MKKTAFISGTILMAVVFCLVAAAPLPILRNQWTTNFPGEQIKGGTFFDTTMTVGQVAISADLVTPGIFFNVGYVGDLGWDTGGKTLASGNTTINGWHTQTGTGSTNVSTVLGRAPLTSLGSTNGFFFPTNASDGYIFTSDAVGNGRWLPLSAGTNILTATLTTTDNTTNVIYSFTPANNTVVRINVNIVAWNSTSSASYGKLATFKNVAGVVTQVGGTSTLGTNEDDAAFEALIILSGTTAQIKVAGNTAKTVNWVAYVQLFYAP